MHIWIAVYFPSWRSRYYQRRMDEKRIFVFITHYHALWVAGQKRERNNKPKSEWSYFLSFSLGLLNLSREKLERGPHFVFRLYIFFSQFFVSHFDPSPIFFSLLVVFLLFSIFSFEFNRLPTTDGRLSKKSDTVDTRLYWGQTTISLLFLWLWPLCDTTYVNLGGFYFFLFFFLVRK